MDNRPIGIFDSGLGGLTAVMALRRLMPEENIVYFADSARVPYGEKRREELFEVIKENALAWNIGLRDHEVIDEINILNATKEAMKDAVDGLSIRPDHVLVDALTIPGVDIPQTGIIKGDANSVSIAAASILAKVTRDRMMVEYHQLYPDYAFDRNKGYGTKAHYEGLDRVGACPIHRKSFLVKYFEGKK